GKWPELERALSDSEKAIPDNLTPFFIAAVNCLALDRELDRAVQYLRKYLAQEPEPNMPSMADCHWRLARVLEKQNHKPEAIAEYQAALQMDPNSPAKQ